MSTAPVYFSSETPYGGRARRLSVSFGTEDPKPKPQSIPPTQTPMYIKSFFTSKVWARVERNKVRSASRTPTRWKSPASPAATWASTSAAAGKGLCVHTFSQRPPAAPAVIVSQRPPAAPAVSTTRWRGTRGKERGKVRSASCTLTRWKRPASPAATWASTSAAAAKSQCVQTFSQRPPAAPAVSTTRGRGTRGKERGKGRSAIFYLFIII